MSHRQKENINDILHQESFLMRENKFKKKKKSLLMRCQKKEADSGFCVIKAPLLEHMLAQTNIHARHNLAIRGSF